MRVAAALAIVCVLASASAAERVAAPRRPPASCKVTVHKASLEVDGKKATRPQAVVVCKRSMRAYVTLDKDYGKSLLAALEKDLKAAKIKVTTSKISSECLDNPLAVGCD